MVHPDLERWGSARPHRSPLQSTMAAYIDLNPVRAGLVDDPKDDRWFSHGAAAAGNAPAREGIATVIALAQRRPEVAQDPGGALATYRMWLFGQGEAREGTAPDGGSARKGLSREAVLGVLAARGPCRTDQRSVRAARPAPAGLWLREHRSHPGGLRGWLCPHRTPTGGARPDSEPSPPGKRQAVSFQVRFRMGNSRSSLPHP
jgi:hypothetical protein